MILFIVSIVLFSEFAAAQARPDSPGSESTVYLASAKLERTQEYDSTPSQIESRVLPGLGFLYTKNYTKHFAYESQFEVSGWNNFIFCTITGNFVYSFATGKERPIVFLEGGYGINCPAIFTSEVVRLDVGTIHLGSGIKLPIGDDELLRITLDYKRFRVYTSLSGDDHTTYRFIGLHIGYGIVYHEPGEGE